MLWLISVYGPMMLCGGVMLCVCRFMAWPGLAFLAAPDASSSVPSSQCSSQIRFPLASSFWQGGYSSFAVKVMEEPFRAGLSLVKRTLGLPAERWTFQVNDLKYLRKCFKGEKKKNTQKTNYPPLWCIKSFNFMFSGG